MQLGVRMLCLAALKIVMIRYPVSEERERERERKRERREMESCLERERERVGYPLFHCHFLINIRT